MRTTALEQSPVLHAHDLYTASIWVTTLVVTLLVAMTKFLTEQLEGQAREIGTLPAQAPRPELEPFPQSCPLLLWNACAPTVGTNKKLKERRVSLGSEFGRAAH